MPLYVVRWPGFNVSLVKARSEEELRDILDEEADPGGCRYEVYRGPVWINFDLPLEPSWDTERLPATSDMSVPEAHALETAEALPYQLSFGGGDTAFEMRDALTSFAFPHLQRLFASREDDEALSPEAVQQAVQEELKELARYLWRREHIKRAKDPKSALLQSLGLTKPPPWFDEIWSHHHSDDDAE